MIEEAVRRALQGSSSAMVAPEVIAKPSVNNSVLKVEFIRVHAVELKNLNLGQQPLCSLSLYGGNRYGVLGFMQPA